MPDSGDKSATQYPFPRGAEWRRWDLHVHTPESVLANEFPSWDQYVDEVEKRGTSVAVLGVTDYCSIEGYKKVLEYRKAGRLTGFSYVLPNIEFRTSPELPDGKAINIHILVSSDDPCHVEEIEHALEKLTFTYDGEQYSCLPANLIKLGKKHSGAGDDRSALKDGILQFKPSFQDFREWYGKQRWLRTNSLVAIANGKDGAGGLSKDAGFSATREDLYKFSQLIFSGKPKDRDYFLGKGSDDRSIVVQNYGSLKPCVHGCDAHKIDKLFAPDLERFCWIKADPTFEGLRQVIHEPEERVIIGKTPPQETDESKVIKSIAFNNGSAWFTDDKLELNSGLVAIIGEKGSGKTALADMIAYGCQAWSPQDGPSSFIQKARDHLEGVEVSITWKDGERSTEKLDHEYDGEYPKVRYLSQDFVERLCSVDTSGDTLVKEIEGVIFSHISEADQLEVSNFDELRRLKTTHLASRRDGIRSQLTRLNGEIVRLEESIASKDEKDRQVKKIDKDIAAIDKQLPSLEKSANQEVAAQLKKDEQLLAEKNKQLSELNRRVTQLDAARARYDDFKETVDSTFADLSAVLEDLEFSSTEIAQFQPVFKGKPQGIIKAKVEETKSKITVLKGNPKAVKAEGETITDLQARIARLEKELSKDKNERTRLIALQQQKAKLTRDRDRLERELVAIGKRDSVALAKKREERWKQYLQFFDLLDAERETLKELYSPIEDLLAEDPTGAKAKFEFSVRQTTDAVGWLNRGRSFIDERKDSVFRDSDLERSVEKSIGKAWDSGNQQEIRKTLGEFLERITGGSHSLSDLLVSGTEINQFYDWFFSLAHIQLTYSLKYGGTELASLSPGTRGIVLLVLYLEMDKEDKRPLVIDQPEGNLDSSSIYDSLVPYLRRAKAQRQVVLVTHNPNLVVGTDADQVIVATAHKASGDLHPLILYSCGSLEGYRGDESIKGLVCRLLEGGPQAFLSRENRYALDLGE